MHLFELSTPDLQAVAKIKLKYSYVVETQQNDKPVSTASFDSITEAEDYAEFFIHKHTEEV